MSIEAISKSPFDVNPQWSEALGEEARGSPSFIYRSASGTHLGHKQFQDREENAEIQATSDAGGGTRTPDMRIMMRTRRLRALLAGSWP
jgi:hypothetical protein